jgi:hypothetical protein
MSLQWDAKVRPALLFDLRQTLYEQDFLERTVLQVWHCLDKNQALNKP